MIEHNARSCTLCEKIEKGILTYSPFEDCPRVTFSSPFLGCCSTLFIMASKESNNGNSAGSNDTPGKHLGKGLGKGLGALINTRVAAPVPSEEQGERIQNIRLDQIVPSPLQPRTEFSHEALHDLIDSIRERGIIQPLIVRLAGGKYELIAGERRYRASLEIGLTEAPVIVRKASDQEVLELALIENLQRSDLNPIEEAAAYSRLSKEFHLTQEDIARRVGKSRASVANAMRLMELDAEVQKHLTQGRLTVGHAKVLLGIKNLDEQRLLAEQIIRRNASVRDTEELISSHLAGTGEKKKKHSKSRRTTPDLPPALKNLVNKLQHRYSTRVSLQHSEKRGLITIEYYGSDDLHRLIAEFGISAD
jgi:ParB family chromosome partitioning protein